MGDGEMRFGFGRNWANFIKKDFSRERVKEARKHLLEFLERDQLDGLDFLDIGCGSGLHSLAAYEAGASKIHSLDYDPNSVATTELLRGMAGKPANWKVERGDALDEDYMNSLGTWSLVYSWGVLHHTGDVWLGLRNAEKRVAPGGLFYLALYSEDVQSDPEHWLRVKQEYNKAGRLKRNLMVAWYIRKYSLDGRLSNVPGLLKRIAEYRFSRGMSFLTDVRDWLGGWPMQFVRDQDVVDMFAEEFDLSRIVTGEACTEFLFRRRTALEVEAKGGSRSEESASEVSAP